MRGVLFGLAAFAAVAVALIFVAPHLISTGNLRDRALAQVEAATGYRIRIDGPVKIAVLPSLDLVARDVGIAQPEANGAPEFATARALRLGLRLGGLLSGKVQITEITLVDARITLPLPSRRVREAKGIAGEKPGGPSQHLTLDKLHIRNGTVTLPASEGAPAKSITGLTFDATLPHASGPLAFKVSGDTDGNDRMSATGSIGSFAHFLEGGPAPVQIVIEAPGVLPEAATINGTATYKDDTLTIAQLAAKSGAHALAGNAAYDGDTLTLTDGTFDGAPLAGTATLQGDTLTADVELVVEGEPVRATGAIRTFDQFLEGAPAPITLAIDAPHFLPVDATLSGSAIYKDDTFIVAEFVATAGEHALSGTATYKNDVVSVTDFTAKSAERTFAGNATYKDDAVTIDMTAGLDGKPAKVTGSIVGIDMLLDGEPAPIELVIDAPDHLPAKASLEGGVSYKDGTFVLTGLTAVSGDYRLIGNGTYKDDILVLNPITVDTGGQRFSGALTAKFAGDVPSIGATLIATSPVKAVAAPRPADEASKTQEAPHEKNKTAAPAPAQNPLASPPGTESEAPVAADVPKIARTPPGGETETAVAPPGTSEPAPEGPAPPGAPRKGGLGWRVEKLDFLAPKDVTADVTLTLDQFVYQGIRIGTGTVKATVSGGKLTAEAPSLKAYGGSGSGSLVIDASGAVPTHRLNVTLTGVDAYPLLRDLAGSQTIQGKAAIALDLNTSGASERAMISSLNGTAKFDFSEGALRGLNVANMLRNLTTGILTGWQFREEATTAFNKFGASFEIADGQAQTDDLRMIGPLVSMGGAGTITLPTQTLKLRVNPFMLASVEGSDGKKSRLGFPVPIAVTGPWDRPFFYPDIPGILENPVAAYHQLNKLGGGLIAVPAKILGIDTGEGGLVEKGVAIPGALTKGVVGGIGQVLGVKKREDAEVAPAAPEVEQPSAVPPAAAAVPQNADAPPPEAASSTARDAQSQQPAAEAVPKERPAAEPAPNQMLQNMFGG